MSPRPLPSFFKILLDRSAPHLELPSGFVRKHLENNIPENPILRSRNGGYSWILKIQKEGDSYCFADGWSDVVEDSELGFGDFLVFWLVDESTFKLSIFSPNGCERDFPPQIQVELDDHDEVEELESVKVEEVEDGDDADEEEAAAEEDEEDEDEDDEEEDEESDEEEEDDDIYDNGGGDEEEDASDEDDDGGGDVDVDGDDGDPYFMTIMTKGQTLCMRLPSEFTRLAGIDGERSVIIENIEGIESKISLLSDSKRYYLSAGWSEFRRVNELCEGDECVFKFIKSEDKLCLAKVTKKRVQAKQPPPPPPAVEVLKGSKGRPPQPCVEMRPKRSTGKAQTPVAEVLKRSRGKPPPPPPPPPHVVEESKDDEREAANKKAVAKAKQPAGKVPPSAEISKRPRGRPRRVEVVTEKKERSEMPAGKTPADEISKRLLRARPPRVEVVEERKTRSKKPAGKAPAAQVLTRKRGRPSQVEAEGKGEGGKSVVKRSPVKPLKRKRGRPAGGS